MKAFLFSLVTVLFCSISMVAQESSQEASTTKRTKKAVFIIVDGISYDQLHKANTPNIDSIGQQGSFSEAYVGGGTGTYSETPTISAVGYNSLLTGTWANKHNVWGNAIKAPNYHYPTIFRLYKDQYPNGSIAVYSTWLDNRTKLVGDGLPATGNIHVDHHFDGMELDTLQYPHDPQRNFMKQLDGLVADHASGSLLSDAPDLSWIYLEFSDDMGHMYGDSEQLDNAIHYEDSLIGKVYRAIVQRSEAHPEEDWLLFVTTDHGRKPNNGKGHGGQTYRERSTWILTNKKTNAYFKDEVPGIVDIAPSIAQFMDIDIPQQTQREWDGVSLFAPVDATALSVTKKGDQLELTWKNRSTTDTMANIYVCPTNNIKSGAGEDQYTLVATVPLKDQKASISITQASKGFCKLVLETGNTALNTWYAPHFKN